MKSSIRIQIVIASALFVVGGCQSEAPSELADAPPPPAADAGQRGDMDLAVARAVLENPIRTDEARERDPRSKPQVILSLLNIERGQRVIDVFGGAGYYADMMAGIVGEDGQVILHNNTPYHKFVGDRVTARYVDNQIPGIEYLMSEVDDLKLEPNSLDAALMVMSYHDLYYFSPQRGWANTDVPLFFSQLRAALKPGGRLVIIDHSAEAGTGSDSAQELHRIDEAFAIQDVEGNGFGLITTNDALRNPTDNRSKIVFDPEFRGKTDRFILLFEKE